MDPAQCLADAFVNYRDGDHNRAEEALENYSIWRSLNGYEPTMELSIGTAGARGVQLDMTGDAFARLLRLALPDNSAQDES
jgi:hypothetical protein